MKKSTTLTADQLMEQFNNQLKKEGRFNPQQIIPQGATQVMFFNKTPKYPKKAEIENQKKDG